MLTCCSIIVGRLIRLSLYINKEETQRSIPGHLAVKVIFVICNFSAKLGLSRQRGKEVHMIYDNFIPIHPFIQVWITDPSSHTTSTSETTADKGNDNFDQKFRMPQLRMTPTCITNAKLNKIK